MFAPLGTHSSGWCAGTVSPMRSTLRSLHLLNHLGKKVEKTFFLKFYGRVLLLIVQISSQNSENTETHTKRIRKIRRCTATKYIQCVTLKKTVKTLCSAYQWKLKVISRRTLALLAFSWCTKTGVPVHCKMASWLHHDTKANSSSVWQNIPVISGRGRNKW